MKKTTTKKVKLIPPDRKQCQVMIRNGSFMTFGPVTPKRCTNKPAVIIAYENKPGADGQRGSMSLCKSCTEVFLARYGKNFATLIKFKKV